MTVDDLVFRSRALAQAHPHSRSAERYIRRVVEIERVRQPSDEIGAWAGYALTTGYCLRRVEEAEVAEPLASQELALDHDAIDGLTTTTALAIRTGGSTVRFLIDEATVVDALDGLIAGEIERRLDQWRDHLDTDVWRSLEDYLAWWVVKGYALRAVETSQATAI